MIAIAMMSDKEVEIRRQFASRLKRPQSQSKRPTLPTENPELMIKLKESTIRELKAFSWQVCKTGNEHTYDDIVLFLLRSYSDKK